MVVFGEAARREGLRHRLIKWDFARIMRGTEQGGRGRMAYV
jgi:hypothetical protein